MPALKIAIVGFGKIAKDQHLPALRDNPDYELVAIASRNARLEGLPHYSDIETLLDAMPEVDAVSLCTPPQVRYRQAQVALARGKHVMLEKPPGATLSEVEDLRVRAERAQRTLFATWHSRHAAGVARAKAWLTDRNIHRVAIEWKEDVRRWHPGQDWIWQPGGLGVFDPGINALSIATAILPQAFFLTRAELTFPANCQAPIAAQLDFCDANQVPIHAELDFRQTGPQTWDIHVETDAGRLSLSQGGSRLTIDGETVLDGEDVEYAGLYTRFAELIAARRSEVDVAPLRHVADAFMLGRRVETEPFHE
ncbi:Gfo/Idh/MocA family oxidoreductase [Halomonas shantousis]